MIVLADEGIDRQIVSRLRQDGHKVWYVAEMSPGISDEAVLELAARESATLLTADKDFGRLVIGQRRLAGGIVLVRLAGLSPNRKAEMVASAIESHQAELPGSYAVVASGTIRIRPLLT